MSLWGKIFIPLRWCDMVITKIAVQEKKKDRVNVFIDGEYSFSLSKETALKYRLKVGGELTDADVREMTLESEKVVATEKAVGYVSKSLKTKKQVYTYLKGKGYSENVIHAVLEKLIEYGYINDKEYAKRYAESTIKNQGKMLTVYKLMMKGVSKDNAESAFINLEGSLNDSARALAEKRLKNKEKSKENIYKTYKYLLSKGFSYDQAEYAISEFKEND